MASVLPRAGLVTYSVALLFVVLRGAKGMGFQWDFNGDLYLAGRRILHGLSPYQPHLLAVLAAMVRAGHTFAPSASPRYPAPVLVAATPFSLLPMVLADVVFMLICAASVVVALRLLGVRDWRCIGLAALSWPVVFGVWTGNLSVLLLLGGASAWRWRSRLWTPAAAIAAVVVAKLFLWPIAVWLLVTRRFRTFAVAVALAVVGTVIAWAVIGFAGLTEYPRMLMNVAAIGEGRGCSLVSALISLGVSSRAAQAVALACGISLLGVAWKLARVSDGDLRAFSLWVMAGLIATPVAWAYYLVLLFIPIALLSPKLSGLWFLPMVAGLSPTPIDHPLLFASVPALTIELFIIFRLCSPLLGSRKRPPAWPVGSRQNEHGVPIAALPEPLDDRELATTHSAR